MCACFHGGSERDGTAETVRSLNVQRQRSSGRYNQCEISDCPQEGTGLDWVVKRMD